MARAERLRAHAHSRRAYTMLELAILLGLFIYFSATITLAVSVALHTQLTAIQARELAAAVDSELQSIAGEPYASLAGGTFVAPNPCFVDAPTSCITVGHNAYQISYSVCPAEPSASCTSATGQTVPAATTSGLPSAYTDITATVSGGAVAPQTQRVIAPYDQFATTSTGVQVNVITTAANGGLTAATVASSETLYLLNTLNASVASSLVGTGTVYFTVPAGDCTAASPCHVGLSTGTGYDISSDGRYALVASSALTPISVTAGSMTTATAQLFAVPATPTSVALEATNYGVTSAPSSADRNTVCVWGSFSDGVARRVLPFCNSVNAAQISLGTYAPIASQPNVLFALDPATPVVLSVDNPSRDCLPDGGLAYDANTAAWVNGAECTSWTWGVPDGFGLANQVNVKVVNGVDQTPGIDHTTGVVTSPVYNDGTAYELLWSDTPANATTPANIPGAPAAGYAGQPSWSKPRAADLSGCAADGTCTSLVGLPAPETTSCPLLYCFSGALFPPYLSQPNPPTITMQNGTATFPVTVGDADAGAQVSATVTTLPVNGTLSLGGTPVTQGQQILLGPAGISVQLTYTSSTPNSAPGDAFTLSLSNGQSAAATTTATITIASGQVVAAVASTPSPISVTQGGAVSVTLHATDSTGAAVPGAVLTLTPGVASSPNLYDATGLSLSTTSVTTDASGNAVVTLRADGSTPVDQGGTNCPCYDLNVATATNSSLVKLPVTVAPAATNLVVSPYQNATSSSAPTVAQGQSLTLYGSVLDASGAEIPSSSIAYSIACTATGYSTCPYSGLVTVTPSTCVTTSAACPATLASSATAPASSASVSYTLTATDAAANLSVTEPITVTPVVYALQLGTPQPTSLGGTGTVVATVINTAGGPVPNYNVTATVSDPLDITFVSATLTTDATGVATFAFVVSSTAPPGFYTITALLSSQSATYPIYDGPITATATLQILP